LTGISSENYSHIHFQQVQDGKAPVLKSGKVKDVAMTLTAGTYVLVAGGSGKTVQEASEAAYNVAWDIEWPGNRMFRTDIGKRLEDELPKLQRHGFALGMEY
jgi:phosphoribosylamine-glycine ligase